MANRGETVKYIIDADTSGFARGMGEAAIESDIAGRSIQRNLSRTAKSSENNFRDIRTSASRTASQIRSFGIALQGFNMTSIILGVTALSGAVIELSGAIAAAGSTVSILFPALLQGVAAATTFKTGVAGLGAAFKAIQKNDPTAFTKSLENLGPAATKVAYAMGGLNKAFNGVRLNTQNALFAGLSRIMLQLGSTILPTINAGMQLVAQAMNGAFKSAAHLASTPVFSSLLATIFADTARNVSILSGALAPLLTIFTNLYLVTRPYVTLLAQQIVSMLKTAAAFLSSAKGQYALNLAIQEGLVAIQELGHLVGAVFGFLTALFRTAVNSGTSLIVTLTGIIKHMEAWVNSATGQRDLISLFNFTSLAIQNVAHSIGIALQFFFAIINALNDLSPGVQRVIVQFLSLALAVSPVSSYFLKLFGAIRLVGTVIFNLAEQLFILFAALGTIASIALVVAGAFIVLGAIIRGPLGGALIIIGTALAAYIGLSYLAAGASATAAGSFLEQGLAAFIAAEEEEVLAGVSTLLAGTLYNAAIAGADAGVGLSLGARGALLLQAALLPLIILAAGVLVILSMLGVFGTKTRQAQNATAGFGNSLGSLQKAMKGIGSTGKKAGTGGLSALNTSLKNIGKSSDKATGSLASFDKMNVLTDNSAAGAGAGIPGLPSLPNFDGKSLGAPTLDTGAFDKSLADMQKNFGDLQGQIGKPLLNPFAALGKWLDSHPWVGLAIFGTILAIVVALFATGAVAIGLTTLPLTLIVLGIVSLIAIIILLAKNWTTVWNGIKVGAVATWRFLQSIWSDILGAATLMIGLLIGVFKLAWSGIAGVWNGAVAFFTKIFDGIRLALTVYIQIYIKAFQLAWTGIKFAFSTAVTFFRSVWGGISGAFSSVGSFFRSAFQGAWNSITGIFGSVGTWFKKNVVDKITDAFSGIGSTIARFFSNIWHNIGQDLKDAINAVLHLPLKIPSLHIPHIGTVGGQTLLPKLALGGVVTSPTFAQIGEAGAEAVMPLENNTEWIDKLASKINGSNNGASSNSNPDIIPVTNKKAAPAQNITIQVSGVFATSAAEQKRVAELIGKQLNATLKSKGLKEAF